MCLLIVKYMKNDKSLIKDVKNMIFEKKIAFLNDLNFLELPIKKEILSELERNEDNEIMEAWRDRRVVMVNGKTNSKCIELLKSVHSLDSILNNKLLQHFKYDKIAHEISVDIEMKYLDVIEDYLKNGNKLNTSIIKSHQYDGTIDELINEMNMIGIELNSDEKKVIFDTIDPRYIQRSRLIIDSQYDDKLKEWLGNDYKWRLIYRASEHDYTASSFHEYCDDKGPTLVIIKSDNECIFGGYTTQSWKGRDTSIFYSFNSLLGIIKYDPDAFIFTLKNSHEVEPTQFMKRRDCHYTIESDVESGPIFRDGTVAGSDICIKDHCNEKNSCWIQNDGTRGYECNYNYKSSLFVNTSGVNDKNYFSVLDYEVYCIDNYDVFINNKCKYPDIIREYIETKDISDESLKKLKTEDDLRNDLKILGIQDDSLFLKLSSYFLQSPSEYLPDTHIVDKKYDVYFKHWCGNYSWELLYRASEHGYTSKSFHECCDGKRPTLIVIKSSEGWIFGGYTNRYWSSDSIYSFETVMDRYNEG